MNELEKCPLCGNIPKEDENSGDVWCVNATCKLAGVRIPRKFWNTRPIEKGLRDDLAELRKEIEDTKADYLEMRNKKDNVQNNLDGLKRDIQTLSASYIDIKKQNDLLLEEIVKYKDIEKKADVNLKTKMADMERAHQYFIDDMRKRLVSVEEILNTLLSHNAKLEGIRMDEYRLVVAALKKIKEDGENH